MNRYPSKLAAKTLFCVASVLAFACAAADAFSTHAQARPRMIPGSPNTEAISTREMMERNQREREFNLRNLGAPVKPTEEDQWLMRQEQQERLHQIQKDYREIQVLNNNLLTAVAHNAPLNYKHLAGKSAEINRRASRLRTHLALPKIEGEGDKNLNDGEVVSDIRKMKAMLVQLDKSIMSFVNSPFFKSPDVIDLELTTKVSNDLQRIIEITRSISRTAEWLNKNPPSQN